MSFCLQDLYDVQIMGESALLRPPEKKRMIKLATLHSQLKKKYTQGITLVRKKELIRYQ